MHVNNKAPREICRSQARQKKTASANIPEIVLTEREESIGSEILRVSASFKIMVKMYVRAKVLYLRL